MTVLLVLAGSWCLMAMVSVTLQPLGTFVRPGLLVRLLGVFAVVFAVATSIALVAAIGTYSPTSARASVTIVAVIAVSAFCAVRCGRHGRQVVTSLEASRVFRRAPRTSGDLVVVDDVVPEAFAVPGKDAVIVVTTGLRDVLSPTELRAVVRHERVHLHARHYFFIQLVELAVCVNPALYQWRDAVRLAAERHADESASAFDRRTTAETITKVAVLRSRFDNVLPRTLGVAGPQHVVVQRVRSLLRPSRDTRRRTTVSMTVAVVLFSLLAFDLEMTADMVQDRISPEPGESSEYVLD